MPIINEVFCHGRCSSLRIRSLCGIGSGCSGLARVSLATKKHEARAKRASENKVGRQKLYAQFIEEASKLYMDALVRDQAEPSAIVSIYALISQMRMASNANVVEKAEAVIRTILATYSRPNKTFPELQNLVLNRGFVDPLLNFSEVCRDELRDFPRGRYGLLRRFRASFGRT